MMNREWRTSSAPVSKPVDPDDPDGQPLTERGQSNNNTVRSISFACLSDQQIKEHIPRKTLSCHDFWRLDRLCLLQISFYEGDGAGQNGSSSEGSRLLGKASLQFKNLTIDYIHSFRYSI